MIDDTENNVVMFGKQYQPPTTHNESQKEPPKKQYGTITVVLDSEPQTTEIFLDNYTFIANMMSIIVLDKLDRVVGVFPFERVVSTRISFGDNHT